jgi:hypothetical protein
VTTGLATIPNVDDIVAGHDRALELYTAAFDKIAEAEQAILRAYAEIENVTPGAQFHHAHDVREIDEFNKAVKLPDRDTYIRTARKLLTLRCWHYVIDRCGMHQLMDAQAKREFDGQLRYVPDRPKGRREIITEDEMEKGPPPFTGDTVRATMATFAGDASMIWRRGIANVFSELDRRFRSHDGFKIGSRIILDHFADQGGSVDRYGRAARSY